MVTRQDIVEQSQTRQSMSLGAMPEKGILSEILDPDDIAVRKSSYFYARFNDESLLLLVYLIYALFIGCNKDIPYCP